MPRLEKIENNVYKPCTYCTYDPKSDGEYQDLVTRLSDANQRKGNGNGHGKDDKNKYQKYSFFKPQKLNSEIPNWINQKCINKANNSFWNVFLK